MRSSLSIIIAAAGLFSVTSADAHAALLISSSTDVVAGRAAFIASGTTQSHLNWDLLPTGSYPTLSGSGITLDDANGFANTLNIRPTWSALPGFEGNDLAINGSESFDMSFASDQRAIGLAIDRGEADALFVFTAYDMNDAVVGAADFTVQAGVVDQAWLTINATSSFRRIELREFDLDGGKPRDTNQFFSDIYSSVENVNTVPEPSSLMLFGLGGLGLLQIRRRRRLGQSTV